MKKSDEKLLQDYLNDNLNSAEIRKVEKRIESGELDISAFSGFDELDEKLQGLSDPIPSDAMKSRFSSMLQKEISNKPEDVPGFMQRIRTLFTPQNAFNPAFALILLIIGWVAGSQLNSSDDQIQELSSEVQTMKQMMLTSMLEGPSTTDRLKAVNISSEMESIDGQTIRALLFTLNNDPSVNVRLQTIQVLRKWGSDERVRQGLVSSIPRQESPNIIIELADTMVELNLEGSKPYFEQLIREKNLDLIVEQKLKANIAAL